jgi:hypothetical protein
MYVHAASGWRIHCGVEVTELSTNNQHTLSVDGFGRRKQVLCASSRGDTFGEEPVVAASAYRHPARYYVFLTCS